MDSENNWQAVPVSEIANIVIGGTPSRKVEKFWNGEIPWATAKDVASVTTRYLNEVQEFITGEGLQSSATKLLPAGTIVITARGTVGALAQLQRAMAFNQTCYAIIPKKGIQQDFLFYALKGTLVDMRSLTYGTVFETITKRTFDNWTIKIPQLAEQKAIAHILGTLDDKIELNRRMSRTLEEMAHAVFQDWFVDFGPTRAKMEGQEPYLPSELWDLFPDELVDSELGEIPEGWEVGVLHDAIEILSGGTPKTSIPEYWNGNIPWYTAKDAPDPSDVFVVNTERSITPAGVVQRQLLLPVPSIILAGSPPVPDCAAGPLRCGSWGRRIPG